MVQAAERRLGERSEISHHGKGHEIHLSGPTVAIARDGGVFVGWIAQTEQVNHLYLTRPPAQANQAVRVNPDGLEVESLHQSPGIAVGPEGEIYVSWSSSKVKPEGTFFASDLRLSRSLAWTVSQAIKAYAPDIAVSPPGDFVVVWHEEQFPVTKTVVQSIQLDDSPKQP